MAFKDALNYHGAEYQWHVDWHFYERTEDDVRELYRQAGYNVDALEVARDKTRIIMNSDRPGRGIALRVAGWIRRSGCVGRIFGSTRRRRQIRQSRALRNSDAAAGETEGTVLSPSPFYLR